MHALFDESGGWFAGLACAKHLRDGLAEHTKVVVDQPVLVKVLLTNQRHQRKVSAQMKTNKQETNINETMLMKQHKRMNENEQMVWRCVYAHMPVPVPVRVRVRVPVPVPVPVCVRACVCACVWRACLCGRAYGNIPVNLAQIQHKAVIEPNDRLRLSVVYHTFIVRWHAIEKEKKVRTRDFFKKNKRKIYDLFLYNSSLGCISSFTGHRGAYVCSCPGPARHIDEQSTARRSASFRMCLCALWSIVTV